MENKKARNSKIRSIILLGFVLTFLTARSMAQNEHDQHVRAIKARSALWNKSYNSRDSLAFFSLFDSSAIVVSLGGKWIGLEKCKYLCRSLFVKRPDINWNIESTIIEVNDQWPAAYETGAWSESWTESGDSAKSEIRGKYWIMWFLKGDRYFILSAIFTPLSCTGSYCEISARKN
jgi:hypothetical protein